MSPRKNEKETKRNKKRSRKKRSHPHHRSQRRTKSRQNRIAKSRRVLRTAPHQEYSDTKAKPIELNDTSRTKNNNNDPDPAAGPTILIAPEDYVNVFSIKKEQPNQSVDTVRPAARLARDESRKKAQVVGENWCANERNSQRTLHNNNQNHNNLNNNNNSIKQKFNPPPRQQTRKAVAERIPSDAPTALIAPDDYQNLYTTQRKDGGTTSKQAKIGAAPAAAAAATIPSDAPTALIAPPDYQHIYTTQKVSKAKVPAQPADDDTPTALIAPEDYQHIYTQQAPPTAQIKRAPLPCENDAPVPTPQPPPPPADHVPSDAPTALIGPEDYQNIFHTAAKQR